METLVPSAIFLNLVLASMVFVHAYQNERIFGGIHSALSTSHYMNPPRWARRLLGIRHKMILKFTYAILLFGIFLLCWAIISPIVIALIGEFAGAILVMANFVVMGIYAVTRIVVIVVYQILYKRKR